MNINDCDERCETWKNMELKMKEKKSIIASCVNSDFVCVCNKALANSPVRTKLFPL